MQIDEPVHLYDYDSIWPQRFELEKAAVLQTLGDQAAGIEHFGSTAVPGLAAKPVIDILVGLKQYPLPDAAVHALEQTGYEHLGEAGVAGRLYFRKRQPQAFNLAIVIWGGKLWRDNLLLRDYLRCQPQMRQLYQEHKRAIVDAGCRQLLAYSAQKAELVSDLLAQAETWAEQGGTATT